MAWLVTICDTFYSILVVLLREEVFPPFCGGLAYILTKTAIEKLVHYLEVSEDKEFLWLDDVFITGILARKAGVKLIDIRVRFLTLSLNYSILLFGVVQALYKRQLLYSREASKFDEIDYLIFGPNDDENLRRCVFSCLFYVPILTQLI